ncbi:MAG TPA: hypothetical protein PKD60_14805 [Turneriella sp.]|nr:hypothetical protein [Turneriella sp.]
MTRRTAHASSVSGGTMATYKIDGAKFKSMEELKETLWPLYKDKMDKAAFDKYVEEKVEKTD